MLLFCFFQRAPLNIVLKHCVDAALFLPIIFGILFFLFEFFQDALLSLAVFCIVWVCDLVTVTTNRSRKPVRFLPQLLFVYLFLFHLYFFRYPLGFSSLALLTTIAFIQHSVFAAWKDMQVM
mmetsp:Transcript_831/g.2419  ORF Transcript_831/g.2419 Transcript_831/m.2419 type:complete len:122 (-) Transcript_831:1150-1515(-)